MGQQAVDRASTRAEPSTSRRTLGITGEGIYRSVRRHDFDSAVTFIEVPTLDSASAIELSLVIESYQDTTLAIRHSAGTLSFVNQPGEESEEVVISTVPYSDTEHRYWRLRETDGRVFWETSSNQGRWQIHATADAALFSGPAQIAITAAAPMQTADLESVRVASINGGGPSAETWCAAESLVDDFEGTLDDTKWNLSGNESGCNVVRSGEMEIVVQRNDNVRCGYSSHLLHNLSDSMISIEAVGVTGDQTSISTVLELQFPNGDTLAFEKKGSDFTCIRDVAGSPDGPAFVAPYDPAEFRWWRFRDDGGTVHWETSPDGVNWASRGTHASPPVDLENATINLLCTSNGSGIGTTRCNYDNLNVTPE